MKVVHLSHTDAGAGAGRAAYRIHRSLISIGVDSSMVVSDKRTSDPTVVCAAEGRLRRLRARGCEYLEARVGRALARNSSAFISPSRFSYFSPAVSKVIAAADVLSLYWINGGFIAPEGLANVAPPIVWRLSDVWPFTGGCHYPGTCDSFGRQCGHCPQLRHPSTRDASHRLWRRKERAWRDLDITVAAPSRWMAALALRSSLFSSRRVVVVPTGVDLDLFRPLDREASRARLGIPADRKVLVFGAMSPGGDPRKGFNELRVALETLAALPLAERLLAVVFGGGPVPAEFPVPVMSLGRIQDDTVLASIYSAADMVIVPSLEDNLPNVALEAIACGAPVAGFDVCGMPDIVRDRWNGVLAPAGDALALGQAIGCTLSDEGLLCEMGLRARQHAEERFSMTDQARTYRDLYMDLADRRRTRGPVPREVSR